MATTTSFAAASPCLGHGHGRASLACRAASSTCPSSSSLRELSISSSAAGRVLTMARPSSSSTARFISVLSVSSRRSVRRNAILALDPDFYRIPHKSGVPVGKRLRIWNLPPNLDKDEFLDWFNSINLPVESFELTDDPELNAQGIGGFIEFTTKQDACMAIVKRDGYKFNGRCIRMDFVEKKPHETPIGGRRNRPSFRSNSMGGGYETRPNPNYVPNPNYAAKNPDYVPNPNYANKPQTSPSYGTGTSSPSYGMGTASSGYGTGAASSGYGNTVPTVQSSPSYTSSSPVNPAQSAPTGTGTPGYGTGNVSSGYGNTSSAVQSSPSYSSSSTSGVVNPTHTAPAPTGTASPGYGTGTVSSGYGDKVPTGQPSSSYSSSSPSGAVNPTQSGPTFGSNTESASSGTSGGYSSYESRSSFGNQSYGNPGYGAPSYGTGNPSSGYGSTVSTGQSSPSYASNPPSGAGNPTQSAPSFGNSTESSNSGTSGGFSSYDSRPSYGNQTYGNQTYGNPSYGGPSYGTGTGSAGTGYGSTASTVESSPSYSSSFPSGAVNPNQSAPSFGNNSETTSSDISGGYSNYESRPSFGNQSYGNSSYGGPSYGSPRPFSSNRVFVGNLPWSADDMKLQEVFSRHGTVLEARIVKDRETGRSRGFGFVSMSTPDEMQAAIQALDGSQMDGRPLKVNEASARF